MSMKKAGWTGPQWPTVLTRDGYEINVTEVGPQDVAEFPWLAVSAELWPQCT